MIALLELQLAVCERYGANFCEAHSHLKLGIAENVKTGLQPINGLRHAPTGDTTGWYIWAGQDLSHDPDFFKPLHVAHVATWSPRVQKFLGLPPGWRFLIADGHEDVWFDSALLSV